MTYRYKGNVHNIKRIGELSDESTALSTWFSFFSWANRKTLGLWYNEDDIYNVSDRLLEETEKMRDMMLPIGKKIKRLTGKDHHGHIGLIRKDVLKLSLPVLLEQVFIMSMGVINTIMAGRIGKEAVSAIGMVDSINNMFIAFFSSLAVGGTVVVAYYIGQGKGEGANESAKQALFSGFLLALGVTVLIWIFRDPLVRILYGSAEEAVLKNAFIYLNITLLTYPLIAITSIACGVLRGAGDTNTPMKVTILMNLLNILLSYLLIYGVTIQNDHFYLTIPALKVKGAAIGIATARIAGTGMIMLALLKGSKCIKIEALHRIKPDWGIQRSIFGIGIPAGTESLLFNGGKLITQVFVVAMGTVSTAANYIGGSIFSLTVIPGSALGIAATTLVGQSMGRGESDEARDTLLYLNRLSSLCLLVLCAFSFLWANGLASLYSTDASIIALSARLIKLSSITTPFLWSIAFVLPAGLKGAGDTKYTLITSVIGMWAFRVVLGYILGVPLKLGVTGIWMGMYVDWLVRGVLYYIRLKHGKWKQNVVIREVKESI